MWIKRVLLLSIVVVLSLTLNVQIVTAMTTNDVQTNSIILGMIGLGLFLLGRSMNKASTANTTP
jgi:uncharacterized membrane protein